MPGNAYLGLGQLTTHPGFCYEHMTLCCPLGQPGGEPPVPRHACGFRTDRPADYDQHLLNDHELTPAQAYRWLPGRTWQRETARRADWPTIWVDGRPVYGHKPTFTRVRVADGAHDTLRGILTGRAGRKAYDTLVACSCGEWADQQPDRGRARWGWEAHVEVAGRAAQAREATEERMP
jgi:hypothetical protein